MPVDRHRRPRPCSEQAALSARNVGSLRSTNATRSPCSTPASRARRRSGRLCRQLVVRDLTVTEPHHHNGRSIARMDTSLNPALAEARFCPRCGQAAEVEFPQRISVRTVATRRTTTPSRLPARFRSTIAAGSILLRRGFDPRRGLWTFPGGFVELGESVEEAARRETAEELGMAIEVERLVGVYSRAEDRVVLIVYRARAIDPPRTTPRGDRGARVRCRRAPVGRARVLVDRAGATRRV